jgi:methionine-S-sulfoxide reductase
MENTGRYRKATFAAGSFWDAEAVFRRPGGIAETVVGYISGTLPDPTYGQVSKGTTGHVEAVGVMYDPTIISYEQLLDIFWTIHDPARADGQGDYTGPQYRSVIFYYDETQKMAAFVSRDRLAASEKYRDRYLVTEILPASTFWPAEECHQHFYEKCALGYCTSRQIYE